MLRRVAAIVLALTCNPALVRAQDAVFTVNVPSADVYKGPTNVTPVIGHVSRGTSLPVVRNLGSWVKIAWPDAPDGFGYVHVTMGRLDAGGAATSTNTSAAASVRRPDSTNASPVPAADRMAARRQVEITPASHIFGVGGVIGSAGSFGATARAWRTSHVGVQFGLTREAISNDGSRVRSIQFEPGVVYARFDHVSDYVWLRPYVGSVLSYRHDTLTLPVPVAIDPASDNGFGYRVFGGAELTFASVPRFGLSADVGYRRFPTSFPGFESDRMNVSIAGHWYIR